MADPQKIHPISHDPEAPQTQTTTPLVPRSTSKSDQTEQNFPPSQRTIPVSHSKPPKKRSCLCKCLCWTLSLLILLIIVIGIIIGILFLVFKPKLPDYSVDKLQVTRFDLSNNQSLEATFDVTITAKNPNKKIGIYYEGGSHISVWYTDTKLCEGGLPKFYQGHRNTTVLIVPLVGRSDNATGLFTTLQQQQQRTRNIPLNLRATQPVRIKLGSLKLMKIKFRVRCRLVVNRVSANNQITIQDSSCKFRLRL